MNVAVQFRDIFGDATSRTFFPELVLLLPDQVKREELARVYEAFERSQPLGKASAASAAPPPKLHAGGGVGVFKPKGKWGP